MLLLKTDRLFLSFLLDDILTLFVLLVFLIFIIYCKSVSHIVIFVHVLNLLFGQFFSFILRNCFPCLYVVTIFYWFFLYCFLRDNFCRLYRWFYNCINLRLRFLLWLWLNSSYFFYLGLSLFFAPERYILLPYVLLFADVFF